MKQNTEKETIEALDDKEFTALEINRIAQLRRDSRKSALDRIPLGLTDLLPQEEEPSVSLSERIPILKIVAAGLHLKRIQR